MSGRAAAAREAAGAAAQSTQRASLDLRGFIPARVAREAAAAISPVGSWLIAAVALDLVVTRLALRLAIFVPRSDELSATVGIAARIAAVVDMLVPIVAVVLLGALLVSAGTWRAPLAWRIGLVATAGVATGGIALTVLPPTPAGLVVLEGLVAIASILLVAASVRADVGIGLRAGLVALGAATALAAIARLADSGAALSGEAMVGAPSLTLLLVGQLTFGAGAIIVGSAGFLAVRRASPPFRIGSAAGGVVAVVLVGATLAAPATASVLLIWSTGLLSSLLPLAIVALAAGLTLGGLVALVSARRDLAIGLAIVLLAGYGLAASGLVLATLMGLALAGRASFVASE